MKTLLRYNKPRITKEVRNKIDFYNKLSEITAGRIDTITDDIMEYGLTDDLEYIMKHNLRMHEQAKHNVKILEGGLQ
jgi:hypothetical protein